MCLAKGQAVVLLPFGMAVVLFPICTQPMKFNRLLVHRLG